MGRAGRWLRGLLGGKKAAASSGAPPAAGEPKKRQRWGSFVKSFREKEKRSEAAPAVAPPYRDEEEQNKRAIAVAAATAAVAEAAVAAAQAAAAVVRLTSSGRVAGGGKMEEWAAVKIQAAFRAYLARRALRALKGLVKLQALVRGNIVRKQAAETLRCMQALVRVQARARACRVLRSDRNQLKLSSRTHRPGPATPEKSEQPFRSIARRHERSSLLKRNSSKQTSMSDGFEQDRGAQSSGLRWLDQWMEERYWDSTKPGLVAMMSAPLDDEKNDKILEIDTGKPHYSSKGKSNIYSSSSPLASDQLSHSFTTVPDSPSKDSTVAQRSVPSPSSVDMQQSLSPLRFPIVDGCDYGESPQFFSASSRPPSSRRGPFTPAKSDCSRSLFGGYSDYPNYMANTESSKAKVRSQSAPKQRLEFEKLGSTRRLSRGYGLGQQQQQQQQLSGSTLAAAQRSASSLHARFTTKAYPGSGRLDRLGMPVRIRCNNN